MNSHRNSRVLIIIAALISLISLVGCEMSQLDIEKNLSSKAKKPAAPITSVLGLGGDVLNLAETDYILVSQTIDDYTLENSPEVTSSISPIDPFLFLDANSNVLVNDESVEYQYIENSGNEVSVFGPEGATQVQIAKETIVYLSKVVTTEMITGWYSDNFNLWAGQDNLAGFVNISNDNENFYILIDTNDSADLQEVHIYMYTDANSLPDKRPAPGLAPYTVENIYDDSIVVTIPIPEAIDPNNLEDFYFIIHAALVEDAVGAEDGTSLAGETAYAGGEEPGYSGKGAWFYAVQFNLVPEISVFVEKTYSTVVNPIIVAIEIVDNGGDDPVVNPGGGSETAFAYDPSAFTTFLELGYTSNAVRWGWTNGPYGPGVYHLDIWAGAGQNDLSKGTKVGTLIFDYNGSQAIVTYLMDPGSVFLLAEVHIFVGDSPLPLKNGEYTLSPGQYLVVDDTLNGVQIYQGIITDLSGPVYLVAHASVLGF